jgi:hypothetical protein
VSIARCLRVHPRFHARHHAKARTYYYRIHTGFHPPSIFEQDRMWHCKLKHPQQLDVPRMQVRASRLAQPLTAETNRRRPCMLLLMALYTSRRRRAAAPACDCAPSPPPAPLPPC